MADTPAPDAGTGDRADLQARLLALHERVCDGDPFAPADLADMVIAPLVGALRRRRGRDTRDPHLLEDAAHQAFISYIIRPGQYDPAKAGLLAYLTMSAVGDLKTLVAREYRHEKRRRPVDGVELPDPGGNDGWEDDHDGDVELPPGMTKDQVLAALWDQVPDPRDREVIRLMVVEGERNTERFARALGIEGQSPPEQRRAVKRTKDRLSKAMQRLGGRLRDGGR